MDPIRVFPVPERSRRKSKSPTPSKSIAKLFPHDRVTSKTPVPDRSEITDRHNPIPKLKLRSIAQHFLGEVPQSLRDQGKENANPAASSATTRGLLSFREESPFREVKMIRLQALGDIMQKLMGSAKASEDNMLNILRSADSPSHLAGGCVLCGCTCKSFVPDLTDNSKRQVREPLKQSMVVDASENAVIHECLSCGNKFCEDAESTAKNCSLCQENCILAKHEKLTLQLKIRLDNAIAEPNQRRKEVSPRLFRLRTDRGLADFPPRFSTPTKNLFPVQHGLTSTKEVQTDSIVVSAMLHVAGQRCKVKLTDTLQSLHLVLPDPSPPIFQSDFAMASNSLPLSEYVSSMSSNLLETQKDLKTLSSKDDQTRLITPKFNGPSSAHDSTTYSDKSHSVVLRQLTDRLELIEAEAEKASERFSLCFNSISADLEQYAAATLKRDVERSLEPVLKTTAPIFAKLSGVSPRLADCILTAFGLVLMVTDRVLTLSPNEAKPRQEVDKILEETRRKMKHLQSGLQECQETYEERLLQLLKSH